MSMSEEPEGCIEFGLMGREILGEVPAGISGAA
jgi:hypothetical protein